MREQLIDNAGYAIQKLKPFGVISKPEAAIVALKVPDWMDVRKANHFIDKNGIFLNAIEYPAVPQGQERFRISVTSEHTKQDIDRLAEVMEQTWLSPGVKII